MHRTTKLISLLALVLLTVPLASAGVLPHADDAAVSTATATVGTHAVRPPLPPSGVYRSDCGENGTQVTVFYEAFTYTTPCSDEAGKIISIGGPQAGAVQPPVHAYVGPCGGGYGEQATVYYETLTIQTACIPVHASASTGTATASPQWVPMGAYVGSCDGGHGAQLVVYVEAKYERSPCVGAVGAELLS